METFKFDRYLLVQTSDTNAIHDCLLGYPVSITPMPPGMSDEKRKFEDDFDADHLEELNAYQDLTSAPDWEKNLGFVLGPRSETAIRVNSYKEESPFDNKPKIRLAMLHRILIEYKKDGQGSYQLMGDCDLDLPALQQLISKLQAAERLLAS